MIWNWYITSKRRENLVKICLNILTADCAGLIIPFALRPQEFHANIFVVGVATALILMTIIYTLES